VGMERIAGALSFGLLIWDNYALLACHASLFVFGGSRSSCSRRAISQPIKYFTKKHRMHWMNHDALMFHHLLQKINNNLNNHFVPRLSTLHSPLSTLHSFYSSQASLVDSSIHEATVLLLHDIASIDLDIMRPRCSMFLFFE
jgi:hypothetical protein